MYILSIRTLFTFLLCSFLCINAQAQEAQTDVPIQLSIGGSFTMAPSLSIDGPWTGRNTSAANFLSVFTDLTINNYLIGRVQYSTLIVSSVDDVFTNAIQSGFELNGAIGYNHIFKNNPKINIPIMATLGFATVDTRRAREAGMQVGITTGLKYMFTNRMSATGNLRYLKGLSVSDGAKFDQTDFSIGIMLSVF